MIDASAIERARCIPIDEEVARRGINLRRAFRDDDCERGGRA
jgi:hypothetical protein